MSTERKASLLFLISLSLYLGLSTGLSLFAPNASYDVLYLLNAFLVSIPAFLIPALIFRRRNDFKRFRAPKFPHIMLCVALGIGCVYLNGALSSLNTAIFYDLDIQSNATTSETVMDMNVLNMILTLGIIPPITEEFIMRGSLLESWRRTSPLLAAVLTSLFFALLHMAPSNLVVYFGMGMLFAVVYLITRNVWLTVTMHCVNNLASVFGSMILKFLSDGTTEESRDLASQFLAEYGPGLFDSRLFYIGIAFFYAILAAAIIVPLLFALRATFRKARLGMFADDAEADVLLEEPPFKEKPSLFKDPFFWIAFGVMLCLNVVSGLAEFGVISL